MTPVENLDPGQPDAIADRLAAEFTDLHGRAPFDPSTGAIPVAKKSGPGPEGG